MPVVAVHHRRNFQHMFEYHPFLMELEARSAPGDALIGGILMGVGIGMEFLLARPDAPQLDIHVRRQSEVETESVAAVEIQLVEPINPMTAPIAGVAGENQPTTPTNAPTVLTPALFEPDAENKHVVEAAAPPLDSHEHSHHAHTSESHLHATLPNDGHVHSHGDHSHPGDSDVRGGGLRAGPIDLAVTQLNSMTKVATIGGIVGISFGTVSQNVGSDPIPWLFTVKETATTPWVQQNGLSWGHAHDAILAPPIPQQNTKYNNYYGQHPHVQLFLFSQPPGNTGLNNLRLLGKSDLKHGFKTTDSADEHGHHFLHPGNTDPYSATLNKSRSWYGPISEIDPVTFVNGGHNHFGFLNGDGHYERNHGEAPNVPGDTEAPPNHANIIEHLLQVPAASIDPTKIRPGTKLFAAASYFIVDDGNLLNNTRYREVSPTTFAFIGAQLPGRFIGPT